MKDRLHKIERVVVVQQQLKRLSEWKLALLRRDEAALGKAQEQLVSRLNDGAAHHGLFVGSMARRLTQLSREAQVVHAESEALQGRVREEALRLKRTERLAQNMARASDAEDEKIGLERIVEAGAARKDDSLA